MNQGVGEALLFTSAKVFFFDELHLSPARYTQLEGFATTPWQIKALYGMASDRARGRPSSGRPVRRSFLSAVVVRASSSSVLEVRAEEEVRVVGGGSVGLATDRPRARHHFVECGRTVGVQSLVDAARCLMNRVAGPRRSLFQSARRCVSRTVARTRVARCATRSSSGCGAVSHETCGGAASLAIFVGVARCLTNRVAGSRRALL